MLGLNQWWAVKRSRDGFIFARTLSYTRRLSIQTFLELWDSPSPVKRQKVRSWRRWREGRNGDKCELVRVEIVETE